MFCTSDNSVSFVPFALDLLFLTPRRPTTTTIYRADELEGALMAATDYKGPGFDSSELKELKQKLVDGCHILDREGITDGFGHVSVRVPRTEAFLTIAGVSPGCATLDRLVLLDFDGRYLGGMESPPYEWPIHACIMRARPDVMSVCHTHSKWSSLFSVLKGGLRPIHMYAKFLPAGGPPIYPASGLIGTVQRGSRRQPRAGDPAHYSTRLPRRACTHGRRPR